MRYFCIRNHFDKNAKLWSQGMVLETKDGERPPPDVAEYFSPKLPHHLTLKNEPEKMALSQMIEHKPIGFNEAMAMMRPKNAPPKEAEIAPEPEPVVVNETKAVKRGK
jgi:hypothetical protein